MGPKLGDISIVLHSFYLKWYTSIISSAIKEHIKLYGVMMRWYRYNLLEMWSCRFDGTAPEPRKGIRSGHVPGSKCIPFPQVINHHINMKHIVLSQTYL